MNLLCPKCQNVMTRYERNGVVVDQCAGCGGLFLDRGELEHLIQAEATYYAQPGAPVPPRPAAPPPTGGQEYGGQEYGGRARSDDSRRNDGRKSKARRTRSFLEDLLDFD